MHVRQSKKIKYKIKGYFGLPAKVHLIEIKLKFLLNAKKVNYDQHY